MTKKQQIERAIKLGYWVSKHPGNRWFVGRDANPNKLAGPYDTKREAQEMMTLLANANHRLIDLADRKE
jgi:hypothetical protein